MSRKTTNEYELTAEEKAFGKRNGLEGAEALLAEMEDPAAIGYFRKQTAKARAKTDYMIATRVLAEEARVWREAEEAAEIINTQQARLIDAEVEREDLRRQIEHLTARPALVVHSGGD